MVSGARRGEAPRKAPSACSACHRGQHPSRSSMPPVPSPVASTMRSARAALDGVKPTCPDGHNAFTTMAGACGLPFARHLEPLRHGRTQTRPHLPARTGRYPWHGRRTAPILRWQPSAADHQSGHPGQRQPELAALQHARADLAGRLRPAREDHPLRPRAHPRAHRACARHGRPWLFRTDQVAVRVHHGQDPDRGRREDAAVCPLLHRGRRRRFDRHPARCARLRGQVLYQGRQLGSGGQQHPGVLHPGRDQVPRPDPRGEDGAGPRFSAGGQRP